MHILFLTDNFPPEINAPASRTYEHARVWVAQGHKVTIITSAPNVPQGKVYHGYTNSLWKVEMMDGMRVIRVWTYIARDDGFKKRLLDYLSFMISSFLASFFVRKVNLVIGTSPQFFTIISAWMVSIFKMRPFIFELRDLWPESIIAVGAMKRTRMLRLFEKIELFMYRRATGIISVTNSFKHNLISRGINGRKICVLTNGVDTSKFTAIEKDNLLISDLNLNNKFVVGYIGTHGLAHALSAVIKAAHITQALPKGKSIHFIFLGDGAEKQKLKKQASELNLTNVTFIDSVLKAEVNRYWSILDISIVHLRKTDLFQTVIPSKIFECMGMGIPILHAVEGESADIIKNTGAGVLVEPENSKEIAEQIISLSSDRDTLSILAKNSKAAAKHFERAKIAKLMLKFLSDINDLYDRP